MAPQAQTDAAGGEIGGALTGPELLRAIDQVGAGPARVECASDNGETGTLWLQDGHLHDVQLSWRSGSQALLRLFTWHDGRFRIIPGPHAHEDVMGQDAASCVSAAAERGRLWRQRVAQLGGLDAIYEVNFATLAARLGDVPDTANSLLRLLDGERCLRVLLDAAEIDELDALELIAQLTRSGILRAVEATPPAGWIPEATAAGPVVQVQPVEEADQSLLLTPVLDTVALPPALPPDANEPPRWTQETTEPAHRIPVIQFPLDFGARRRRLAEESAALQAKLARLKDRATLLTREVLAPGAVIPPGLTEEVLLANATEVLVAGGSAGPVQAVRPDDSFERFFAQRQRRFRTLAAIAVIAAAALTWTLIHQWSIRRTPAPPARLITPISPLTVDQAASKPAPALQHRAH